MVKGNVKIGAKKRRKNVRKTRRGGNISLAKAIRLGKNAIKSNKVKNVSSAIQIAMRALKRLKKPIVLPRRRVIRVPKTGGFLPLVPIIAALGALGSLGGGAAAIAKAVNESKVARDQLAEATRHNKAMEAKQIGSGLYMRPYKKGCGLYFDQTH